MRYIRRFNDLTKQVGSLKNIIETQSNEIMTLESYLVSTPPWPTIFE